MPIDVLKAISSTLDLSLAVHKTALFYFSSSIFHWNNVCVTRNSASATTNRSIGLRWRFKYVYLQNVLMERNANARNTNKNQIIYFAQHHSSTERFFLSTIQSLGTRKLDRYNLSFGWLSLFCCYSCWNRSKYFNLIILLATIWCTYPTTIFIYGETIPIETHSTLLLIEYARVYCT